MGINGIVHEATQALFSMNKFSLRHVMQDDADEHF